MGMDEIFEYRFTKLDPIDGAHIDPPSVAIYETLLNKGPGDVPRPGLASSWQVLEGGLVWQLRLRAGARFHSGARCDAAAVVAALERCRWGDGRQRQLWYWDPVDHVTARDDSTVELRLHYPYLGLPTLLWGTHTAICNDQLRGELGDGYGVTAADGTGPYRLVSFTPEEVVAERADGASVARSGVHPPAVIRWHARPSAAARQAALVEGTADVVRAVGREEVREAGRGRWLYQEQPEVSQFYLGFNFDDPRGFGRLDFRRAVEAFIDRGALVREALDGMGDGRRSPVPVVDRHAAAFDPAALAPMPEAEAEAVFDQLGFPRGPRGVRERDGQPLRIDCVTQDTEPFRQLTAVLAAQLARAGLCLEFRYLPPFEDFYQAVEARPAAFVSKWLWQDAIEAVMGFSRSSCAGPDGGNWQGSHLPAVDAAYDRFLQAATPAEATEGSRGVQEAFMRELPYIPLCSPAETFAVSPRLAGFTPVPGTLYPLYNTADVPDD
jgi:ABC-type transport system substrate-binding protein